MRFSHSLSVATAISACLPLAAMADPDPRPPIMDFITFDRLAETMFQFVVTGIRTQVDFTYDHVSYDILSGQMALSGLTIYPSLDWKSNGVCIISAQRALIETIPISTWDEAAISVSLIGLNANLNCLPPEPRGMATAANLKSITVDRLAIDANYRFGSAALDATIEGTFNNIAHVEADVEFSYVSFTEGRGGDPEPLAYLTGGSVVIEDQGLWNIAKTMIPPEMTEPAAAAAAIQGGLTQAIQSAISTGDTVTFLNEEQSNFVQSAGSVAGAYVASQTPISIELNPPGEVYLSPNLFDDPNEFFKRLRPMVTAKSRRQREVLPIAFVQAAIDAPTTLSEADALRAGQALLTGIGAPQDVAAAMGLLQPMVANGNIEALQLLSDVLEDRDPRNAYLYALQLGSNNADGALARLDRLEELLGTIDSLSLQSEAVDAGGLMYRPKANLQSLRNAALAHLTGLGATRSYNHAYLWASLGATAGDLASQSLIEEIDARMSLRGDAVSENWATASGNIRARAFEIWMNEGLGAAMTEE